MVEKMIKYIELNFVKVVNLLIKLIRMTKSEFGWEEKQRANNRRDEEKCLLNIQ